MDGEPSVTLHSSWRGIVGALLGGLFVTAIGVYGTVAGGLRVIPVGILVLGVVIVAIALLDFPVAARFDRHGVERRMVLRRHVLPWDRVEQLTRERPRLIRLRRIRLGGLAAKIGRRRYLLVDQCESGTEHDALVDLLAPLDQDLGLDEIGRPDTEVPPTFTYRRRRWWPET